MGMQLSSDLVSLLITQESVFMCVCYNGVMFIELCAHAEWHRFIFVCVFPCMVGQHIFVDNEYYSSEVNIKIMIRKL